MSRDAFIEQLVALRDSGYEGCTVEDACDAGESARPAAISFDDGTRGQYERAFPALLDQSMRATFFITTGWVGRPGYVTWSELAEMAAAGMSIQSHTATHPFLSELTESDLRDELVQSKARLEDVLGRAAESIALPGGDLPQSAFRHILSEVGYRRVATSRWGTNQLHEQQTASPTYVRRCTIAGDLGLGRFKRIAAGDAWLGARRRLRDATLASVRKTLGPSRYAAVRRVVLDRLEKRDAVGREAGT